MTNHYTQECKETCRLMLEPVPGATHYPKRLVCAEHGYPGERRYKLVAGTPDPDKPNDYVSEVASPADVQEIGGKEISVY